MIRLYTTQTLEEKIELLLDADQSHCLAHVMRCKVGDFVSLFNGSDGQWQGEISSIAKKSVAILPLKQTRPQTSSPDLWLVFAPLKNKTELVVEKAVELGVSKIIPIVTRHSVVRSVNMEKLTIHAIEAAEQCERLDIPALETHKDLSYLLGSWEKDRVLLFGDESGGSESLTKVLGNMKNSIQQDDENSLSPWERARVRAIEKSSIAILIGPEGGFAADEFEMLRASGFASGFGMGGRILRADTAAVAALACIQSVLGDWDVRPHFIGKNS